MAEILHQLIGSLSHYFQGFIHPRWCRNSSINSTFLNLTMKTPQKRTSHWKFEDSFRGGWRVEIYNLTLLNSSHRNIWKFFLVWKDLILKGDDITTHSITCVPGTWVLKNTFHQFSFVQSQMCQSPRSVWMCTPLGEKYVLFQGYQLFTFSMYVTYLYIYREI